MPNRAFQDAVNQAIQLHRAGRLPEAEELYRQLLRTQPGWGDGHAQLAGVLFAAGKLEAAVSALNTAIERRASNLPFCLNNLGVLYDRLGRFEDAATAYRKAIALAPGYSIAHRNLGDALRQLEQYEPAEASYRQALELDPNLVDGYIGVGLTLYHRRKYAEAVAQFEIAMKLDPGNVNACLDAVLCYGRLGDRDTLEKVLRQTSMHEPALHSGLIMVLNYTRGADVPYMLNESLDFNRQHIAPLASLIRPLTNNRDPNRKLRIGYISPDFKHHSVTYFLLPVLEHHDHERFFIACYAEVAKPDQVTLACKEKADLWRSTVGLSDDQVADQIRADGIDILIDLAGHTVDNRLPVLGRRPAPIQISWLGYPNTTGVSTIDYRLTDRFADPDGANAFYSEKLVRLPDAFFVYQPPANAPEVSPLPMKSAGHITFGSFNNIVKITPQVGQMWADLLNKLPDAKLILAGVVYSAGPRLRALIPGISADRIETVDSTTFDDYLRMHDRVDIALDPYPWAGHTTTCHELWMGVPVISLAGPTAISRAGVSVMGNLQMEQDWVAHSPEEYVNKAVAWANRPDELAALRAGLRERMRSSTLMDAERFTRNLENRLRELWVRK